jgi:hypothetical protein
MSGFFSAPNYNGKLTFFDRLYEHRIVTADGETVALLATLNYRRFLSQKMFVS